MMYIVGVETRGYVQKELKEALDILDPISYSKIYVIAIRLDNCRVSHRRVNVFHIVIYFLIGSKVLKKF